MFCKSSVGSGVKSTAKSIVSQWATNNKASICGSLYDFTVSSRLPVRADIGNPNHNDIVSAPFALGKFYWLDDASPGGSSYSWAVYANNRAASNQTTGSNSSAIEAVPVLELSP